MLRQLLSLPVSRAVSLNALEWGVLPAVASAQSTLQDAIVGISSKQPTTSSGGSTSWRSWLSEATWSTGGATRAASTKATSDQPIKKPLNAMNIFVKEHWAAVKAERNSTDSKEVMRDLAQRWKDLSDADKASYKQKAESSKSPEWIAEQARRKIGNPAKVTGYSLYLKEAIPLYMQRVANGDSCEAMKLAGKGWRELTDDQKKVYIDKAARIKQGGL